MMSAAQMSADQLRAELYAALQSLSELTPEMRAGQLMAAIGELCADLHGRGLWDATDEEFLESVWQYRRHIEKALDAATEEIPQELANPV